MSHPAFLTAGNAGPFTLDGTRTYRVGRRETALVDPGPDVDLHVRALVTWVSDASSVRILVTHGHGDHTGAARALAEALDAPVYGPAGVASVDHPLRDGDALETDGGSLVAVSTPGHSREHFSYLWRERRALFAGDLLLGRGDTTWVGEYPGCVADYLASLERLRALDLAIVYPAHGDPLEDVPDALERYERHRRARIEEVEAALGREPDATASMLLERIYGPALPARLEAAALRSVEAILDYVRTRPHG